MKGHCLSLLLCMCLLGCQRASNLSKSAVVSEATIVPVAFSVDELQRRTFNYFWAQALSGNYQIPDRWPTQNFSSIAATGFGLSAYQVGVKRGYVTRVEAAERTLQTLRVLWELPQGEASSGVSGYKGFFYHFLTNDKALRFKTVELSTIDTGLLMAGVLSAQAYFDEDNTTENEIRRLADALYQRVEWDWMLDEEGRISMGWHPERGFLSSNWHGYNEAMILIVLAMASPTHPIPANSWELWCETYKWATFQGQTHLNFDPLFGHQYSQMYIDFRGIQDDFMRRQGSDYFINSKQATLANRNYCIANPMGFVGYGPQQWGLTACDGPVNLDTLWQGQAIRYFTYRARGAASQQIIDDGTIAPTAAGGSVPFAPEECLAALANMWTTHYDKLVGQYGFKDAFNLTYTTKAAPNGWFAIDYLGIDQGPILLQIENHRSGLLWETMKRSPYIKTGLLRAGFRAGWLTNTEK